MASEDKQDSREGQESARRRTAVDPRLAVRLQRTALEIASLIVGWGGVAMLVAALFWWATIRSLTVPIIVLLAVGGAGVVFWVAANFAQVRRTMGRRQFRVGYRHHVVKDMTEARIHSLSEQTIEVLKGLDKDVEFLVFLTPESQHSPAGAKLMDYLNEYVRHSRHVKLSIHDPAVEPELVEKYKKYDMLTMSASSGRAPTAIVVQCGDRHNTVSGSAEADLTSAILQVTTKEKPKVYFLSGHGEWPLVDPSSNGGDLSNLKRTLTSQQYETATLILGKMKKPEIPKDCTVLVIAGATYPIPEKEMQAIKRYVDGGGKLLIALNCGPLGTAGEPPSPDFSEILKEHGIEVQRGMVIDVANAAGDLRVPAITNFEDHPIVNGLQLVVLPTTCALKITETPPPPAYPGAPPPPAQKVKALLKSSSRSWLETSSNPKDLGPGPGEPRGPLVLAAAVDEGASPPTPPGLPEAPPSDTSAARIVVFGDSEFLTNRYNEVRMGLWGNADMAAKSIAWLAARKNLVSIPPKREMPRFLSMKRSQRMLVTIVCVGIIPLLIIVSGAVVWFMRRRG